MARDDDPVPTLIARSQSGDGESFAELFRRFRPCLEKRIASRMGEKVRARAEVDDVLQETFARAFRSIGVFRWRGEGSFFRWMAAIAERVIWNLSQKKEILRLERSAQCPHPTPSRAARRLERHARLERALRGLSPDHREVLVLARLDGLTTQEIAERMGRTPDAVRKLLARAILALRRSFGDTDSFTLPARELSVPASESHREGEAEDLDDEA